MMTLARAAQALSARHVGGEAEFACVSTDSRACPPGALFVALRGERFDGHNYVGAVRESGAVAAMVDRASGLAKTQAPLPLLEVEDTRIELGRLAAYWRGCFTIPLIAVAGSNGKTTVKEMIAAILREFYGVSAVLATEGNYNNDIGLPLTLLKLRESHRAAVVEIGMNHPGETARLAAIAKAPVALVNNAQREHQEFMKSVADVAREHAALFAALPPGGTAVINADDAFAPQWRDVAQASGATVRDFGLNPGASVHADCEIRRFSSGMRVHTPEGEIEFELPLPGVHNVRNALAALAAVTAAHVIPSAVTAAHATPSAVTAASVNPTTVKGAKINSSEEMGLLISAAARALQAFGAVKGRMQRKRAIGGATLIDDTYNANPESVLAAIDVLAASPSPRVLILGDMGEVGDRGAEYHAEIGARAKQAAIDHVITLGELSLETSQSFGQGFHASSLEDLIGCARGLDHDGATLLVKGSRFMRMERVVEALISRGGA